MMDRLTDNEIVKVLECCVKQRCESCLQYGMYADDENCMRFAMENALDIISRKDQRITEYETEIERLKHILVSFMSEVENWEHKYGVDTSNIPKIAVLGTEKENCIKQAKSEAYREFAEVFTKIAHGKYTFEEALIEDINETLECRLKALTETNE